jgi:hypothetical protein
MTKTSISALLLATFIAVPTASSAFTSTTLSTYDSPYTATLSLEDAGRTVSDKRAISYRIAIKSKACWANLEGKAVFFARSDEQQDDSAFLRNGEVVKTNIFKGIGPDNEITLTMDVESKTPKYADVVIKTTRVSEDACIRDGKIGLVFFQKPR